MTQDNARAAAEIVVEQRHEDYASMLFEPGTTRFNRASRLFAKAEHERRPATETAKAGEVGAGLELAAQYHDQKAARWRKEAKRHYRPSGNSPCMDRDNRRALDHERFAEDLRTLSRLNATPSPAPAVAETVVYPRMQIVRGHKHTCANVQIGSTWEDKCDCGALDTAGNAIEAVDAASQAIAAERERCAKVLDDRAAYFERTKGHFDREDAARSYRASAADIRKGKNGGEG